jgi:hypothetical protein
MKTEERKYIQEPHEVLPDCAEVEAEGKSADVDVDGEEDADGVEVVRAVEEIEERCPARSGG